MNIYVGNLPLDLTTDELRQIFQSFGEVAAAVVMNDRYIGSGQPRAYGYVQMESKSEGQSAVIALQETTLKGQVLKVVEALPLSHKGLEKIFPIQKRGNYSTMKTRER